MNVKIKKYAYKKIASIFIRRIDCTAQNILKLISVFEFHNILVIIDTEDDLSSLFLELKEMEINHTTAINANNSSYTNVSLLSNPDKCKKIITDAFKYTPEDIFLVNVNDESQWKQYLQNKTYFQGGKLVENNGSDLCISVDIDEFEIGITLNTQVYDASVIVSKIKELFC
ncbi:MAG: hypothetical protein ACOX45_07040 [Acutalibacteraceae bacterium]